MKTLEASPGLKAVESRGWHEWSCSHACENLPWEEIQDPFTLSP